MSIETKDSLPQDVHEMAVLRNKVIAWTSLDPVVARDVGTSALCHSRGASLFLPCFWPHLLVCVANTFVDNKIRNQYWILTATELKVVTKDHDGCCFPECIKTGDSVQTIPLDSIVDCGSSNARNRCVNLWHTPLSKLYVDTKGHNTWSPHKACGYGLAHHDWFVREVLNRRDILVSGKQSLNASSDGAVVATPAMERGGSTRSEDHRMKDITELYNSGVVTSEEFLEKRKDIMDSM